ncbi:amino acid ABC transporter permease [Desulfitobacterium metallireducens]|uniref:Amino acid ABC transporter permease n=1 Tax=Desulfitobacterium metallireducens DSM 15288 TaxID=871968 RepID=W0EGF2_9FIRM|nr:amino acid ABC transporter permease [Desulfitobacterium metallireducens]AHF08141.1 amino acid ABC transporter permease [Desulfitobacterium metallireducens DSM 15288]
MEYLSAIIGPMLEGTTVTLQMFFATIILSLPLGLFVALGRISRFKPLKSFIGFYIWLFRGTPLMLQLLFVYYALPFIPGVSITLTDFQAALLAFVLNYGAYFAEIFRAGIQSIDRGQFEGAKVLGMTYGQTMRRIVLPQVIKNVLPPVSNETITLVKDTSLIYVLAMNDLLRTTRALVQRDFSMMPFVVAAIFYLAMTLVLTKVFQKLEQRYSAYDE